ncbi:hypothetical protein Gpo141_00001395 [Globisporangium polare]
MRSDAAMRTALRKCFVHADQAQRGYLGLRDLKCGVAATLGIRASKVGGCSGSSSGNDANGGIESIQVDLETFTRVLMERMSRTDLLEDVRRAFKAMDVRSQGFISRESFDKTCSLVLPHASKQVLLGAFREADRDGDSRVTYQDFERMYLSAVELDTRNTCAT